MEVNVQNTCVRVFTQDEVVNLQPLVVLTQDLSGVAQQDTLVQGITDIRTDISGISIDTSTLAKQGTNSGATLTATQTAATNAYASAEAAKTGVVDGNDTAVGVAKEIRSEVGTGSDTAAESGTLFAVLKWVKDKVKSIFNLIGTPASGQPSTLFAAIAAGGGGGGDAQESTSQEILSAVNSIVNAHILNNVSLDGYVFVEGYTPYGAGSIFSNRNGIYSIIDSGVEYININAFAQGLANLSSVSFPNLIRINNQDCFYNCSTLRSVDIPKVEYLYNYRTFSNCPQLIKIVAGEYLNYNNVLIDSWSPTEALLSTSTSLVEAGETFSSNLEKLLYNIRTYIAANLPDRTGLSAYTIKFSSAMKDAINGDTATANAFTNKNWTIA